MNEPDILYPAIFVFSMLMIGLLLTMWEFSRIQKRANKPQAQPVAKPAHEERSSTPLRKVSGF